MLHVTILIAVSGIAHHQLQLKIEGGGGVISPGKADSKLDSVPGQNFME